MIFLKFNPNVSIIKLDKLNWVNVEKRLSSECEQIGLMTEPSKIMMKQFSSLPKFPSNYFLA